MPYLDSSHHFIFYIRIGFFNKCIDRDEELRLIAYTPNSKVFEILPTNIQTQNTYITLTKTIPFLYCMKEK